MALILILFLIIIIIAGIGGWYWWSIQPAEGEVCTPTTAVANSNIYQYDSDLTCLLYSCLTGYTVDGTACNPNGSTCNPACTTGSACVGGKCQPPASGCSVDTDCTTGYTCFNSKCQPQCSKNADCTTGYTCVNGICQSQCSIDVCTRTRPGDNQGTCCTNYECTDIDDATGYGTCSNPNTRTAQWSQYVIGSLGETQVFQSTETATDIISCSAQCDASTPPCNAVSWNGYGDKQVCTGYHLTPNPTSAYTLASVNDGNIVTRLKMMPDDQYLFYTPDKINNDNFYRQLMDTGLTDCATACINDTECKAFGTNAADCELYNIDISHSGQDTGYSSPLWFVTRYT